ncbi:MAG TPA: glycosyltransferase family 2 protein [Ignavibacteria bacterium]|nr:glycosyltransferase family 2 protein [Ignavibacteria bacterium]
MLTELYINYGILIFLILIFIINIINIFSIKKIINNCKVTDADKLINIKGKISVLIPVRNEENNILKCLNSVLNQEGVEFELIILNDNSTDNTANILKNISNQKVKIIHGKKLEQGWIGKNYACHQLWENSTGDYLLFIDADTEMKSGGLRSVMDFIQKEKPDLLSLMPEEETKTFWEKIIIPMLHFTFMNFLPIALVEKTKSKKLSMSNGQFMLFKRESYENCGGHKKLKNKIVEDVWFGRLMKQNGMKVIMANGIDVIKCRMYSNFREIWEGFSKNLFPGLSFSVLSLINIILIFGGCFVLPVLFLLTGLINGNSELILISGINVFIPVIIRFLQALKFNLPLAYSFLNFISCLMIILIGLNSLRILKFGKGSQWKGRIYQENEIK